MTNTDTSQAKVPSKPDYSHVNTMNVKFLEDYKEICAKLDAKGKWHPKTRRFHGTHTPFDKEMLTISLKPVSFMGMMTLIEFAAMFRRLQSIAGRLDDEKKKWIEDNLGISGEWLTKCDPEYCELTSNFIERLVNRTVRPYDVLQNFKWDTNPGFQAFLGVMQLAASGRLAEEQEKEKDDSAGTTTTQD